MTYTYHFTSGSPDWTINATWLQRVSDVVDMATARGLYVITNMHHGANHSILYLERHKSSAHVIFEQILHGQMSPSPTRT